MNFESPEHKDGWEQYCEDNNIRLDSLPWDDEEAYKHTAP